MEFKHKSVLLEETIDNLNIKPDGIYVDGTLGGAGHSYQIAKRLTGGGRLIGIDQDADAIAAATERLKEFEERVTIVRNNYCNMDKVLDELGIDKVDGTKGSQIITKCGHYSVGNDDEYGLYQFKNNKYQLLLYSK